MEFKISNKEVFFRLSKLDQYIDGHNGFIAGGVFKNLFNDEPIRDVDLFFRTESDYKQALEHFKRSSKYKKSYENENCYAFYHKVNNVTIELVKRFFMTPIEVIEQFDFSIVRAAYYKEVEQSVNTDKTVEQDLYDLLASDPLKSSTPPLKFIYVDRFFEDLHQRKLVIDIPFDKIPLPANTFDRAFKYQRYGYSLCRESKVKLIEALRNLQGDIDFNRSLYYGID